MIFVGEIPDEETAEVAVQVSSTGHLVLATLHTDSAVGSVSLLAELGRDPIAIDTSLRGALAQRLVRKPCTHCGRSWERTKRSLPRKSIWWTATASVRRSARSVAEVYRTG